MLDTALVNWRWVRDDALRQRGELETRVAQLDAEIRVAARPPKRHEQERLAAMQDNIDALDMIVGVAEYYLD